MLLSPRMATRPLPDGLYDALLTASLADGLRDVPSTRTILRERLDANEGHERLAKYFATELARVLAHFRSKDGGAEKQVAIVNELLTALNARAESGALVGADVITPPELLLAVHAPPAPPQRPSVPLAVSTLLTHAKGEPRMGAEIVAEIASADSVDTLVSFIKWHGWRRLRDAFEGFARAGKRLRVLTTTYLGATDREALDAIAELPGAEVRVSFDARRTRLHAKAWLFSRETGFSSVYVGSANVSSAALSDGLEWSLKASEADAPHILTKFRGAFDSLWEDGEFEAYRPEDEAQARRLTEALAHERGSSRPSTLYFDLRPYDYQRAILDKLGVEREEHQRHRNLVVAATGTGKTMIAAFDYAAQSKGGVRPRLLFVAHREEILEQALHAFRNVLRDHSFGALLKGGAALDSHDHLFATIQSVRSRGLVDAMGPTFWDYVVVDEFHHAAAPSYRDFLDRVRPRILLGLTATPERSDAIDVLHYFDQHVAADIRLWYALEKQLLVPFEYYGIADDVSLEGVTWRRGGYDLGELDGLYTGNDARAALVLAQLRRMHPAPDKAKGLGFCVSVDHAEFMAERFSSAGIPSFAVHGGSSEEERDAVRGKLERGEVAFVFTCDLYNEGVDLPFVDTLLLLRPTESATLFLQQLGRGLRLHPGKTQTLVLDFIGQQRREYRFDRKLTAMTGVPRGQLGRAADEGFPQLPSGCHLQLERVARDIIVQNLKQSIQGGVTRLSRELAELARSRDAAPSLAEFLDATGRELGEVYSQSVGGWTTLRRAAGVLAGESSQPEARVSRRLRLLLHVDEPARLALYRRLAAEEPSRREDFDARDQRRLLMLGLRLFGERGRLPSEPAPSSIDALLAPLLGSPPLRQELVQLCDLLTERVELVSRPADVPASWALAVHRTYAREEILAGVGRSTLAAQRFSMEGVHRIREEKVELFFVTLDKAEKRFSPTTSYEDYAISPTLFHWQSQSTTSDVSPTGRKYVEGGAAGWRFYLFARPTVDDQYVFLGPVRYSSHQGSRPMSITWKLEVPIPPALIERYATLRAG